MVKDSPVDDDVQGAVELAAAEAVAVKRPSASSTSSGLYGDRYPCR